MKNDNRPLVNPVVMLREEFDDWAVLFDVDRVHGFGLNPTGVFAWKLLDGEHTMDALVEEIRHHADNVPDDVSDHVTAFVDRLVAEGLAGLGDSAFGLLDATHRAVLRPEKCSAFPPGELSEGKQVTYEPPQLVNLSGHAQAAYGDCVNVGSHANNCTVNGHITCCCNANGTSAYQGAHGGITPCYGGCGAYYQGATPCGNGAADSGGQACNHGP